MGSPMPCPGSLSSVIVVLDLDRGTGETGYGPDESDKHEKQDNVYDNNTDNGR